MKTIATEIENYHRELFDKIPICKSMGVKISQLSSDFVTIQAPLLENINYHGTAFGGSLNTVAVLSCYLMLHHLLKIRNVKFKLLVIQKSEIEYFKPTTQDFTARCELPDKETVNQFVESCQKKKRGRIILKSDIRCEQNESPRVTFFGTFVVTLD